MNLTKTKGGSLCRHLSVSKQSTIRKGGELQMTLEEHRQKAERVAQKARALGFTQAGFLLRDSCGHEVFAERKLDELLGQYRAGDKITVAVLLNLGRSKVRIQEASA
jgi:hypothetical protein